MTTELMNDICEPENTTFRVLTCFSFLPKAPTKSPSRTVSVDKKIQYTAPALTLSPGDKTKGATQAPLQYRAKNAPGASQLFFVTRAIVPNNTNGKPAQSATVKNCFNTLDLVTTF
jgi:hypothetical protein